MRAVRAFFLFVVAACGHDGGFGPVDAGPEAEASLFNQDATTTDSPVVDPDAACAAIKQVVDPTPLPVDIIWLVDNSSSMAPAVAEVNAGLNDFAKLIAATTLDYRVIMLSLLPSDSRANGLYPVCIPQPLADNSNCGDNDAGDPNQRFFQTSINVKSTQTFEQLLGSLAQVSVYAKGGSLGGEPWIQWLRPTATKTFVFVTDDNARMTAIGLETWLYHCQDDAGTPPCDNAFNNNKIGPGLLEPHWNHLFDGFMASGVYGWGDENQPDVRCVYDGGAMPAASGANYTDLIQQTGGPRAQICAGHAAWGPFFQAVTTAVLANSKINCTMDIPDSGSTLDPKQVNVTIDDGTNTTTLTKVPGVGGCGTGLSWYYDDDTAPTKVILCPEACKTAQSLVANATDAGIDSGKIGSVDVLFGCATIVK